MAKQTHDREDLLRDGVAMTIRGRLMIADAEVVLGFRPEGQLSLYWDQDPVFQFDLNRQLRRVYWKGKRIKAEQGRLQGLSRQPQESASTVNRIRLNAEPLQDSEQAAILQDLKVRLQQIHDALTAAMQNHDTAGIESIGSTPDEFATKVLGWIAQIPDLIEIADDSAL